MACCGRSPLITNGDLANRRPVKRSLIAYDH